MKRFFLLSLILFASISSTLMLGFPVNAASDYGVKVTTSIHIGGTTPSGTCDLHEMNTQWASFMSSNTANQWSYKNTWNYTSNYDNSRQTLDTFANRFAQNLATGSGWAVQQGPSNDGGAGDWVRIFTFDPDAVMEVHDGYISASKGDVRFVSFMLNPNAGCRFQALHYQDNYASAIGVGEDYPILLVATESIIYPSDYIGEQIPSAFTPKPDFYVPYILNVDDKKLTITPKPADTGGKCWKWASTLVKKGTSTSDNFADWEVISETDYLASNASAELKARDYGNDYAIGMMPYNCDAPAAPISDSYNLKLERIYPLRLDGSSYVLDSDDMGCESGGLCEPPSPFEDCTTYGTDLIGGIGCQIRNFGVLLRSLFITLFVPSPGFLKDYFTEFKDFINVKLGFLIWPVTWSVDFVSAFFNGVNGTNNICNWSFGNIFNSDFKLNFCSLEQNFPTAFNTARYMIQAFTVFMLVSGLYAHYRRILKT